MKNKYQEKFSDKKAPINKSKLWEQISTDKNFPKKKENSWGRFLLFTPLILGLIFLTVYISKTYTISPTSKRTETQIENQNTFKSESNYTGNIENNNSEIDNTTSHNLVNTSREVIEISHDGDNKNKNRLTGNTIQPAEIKKTKSASTKEISKGKTNKKVTTNSNFNTHDLYRTISSSTENNSEALNNSSNQFVSSIINLNNENTPAKIITDKESVLKLDKELQKELNIISYLSKDTPRLKWENRLLGIQEITIIDIKKSSSPSWTFGLMAGIGITNHELKNLLEEDNITQLRIDNATNLETQIINLSISKILPYGIKLSIEGELANAYQRFDFLESTDSIVRNLDSSLGFYSTVTTSTDYELYHRYKFLNINLVASKIFNYKRLQFALGGGLVHNTSFSASGQMRDENMGSQQLSNFMEYRSQINISYFGNLEAIYSINKKWNLVSQVRLGTNKTLTTENFSFDHRIRSMSLGVGIEYNF